MTPDHIPPNIGPHDESVAAVVEGAAPASLAAQPVWMAAAQACCCSSDGCRANGCAIVRASQNVANAVTTEHPAPSQSALIAQLVEAGDKLLAAMFGSYKARNGRDCYIEGDNGERCLIVNSEDVEDFRTALAAARGEG